MWELARELDIIFLYAMHAMWINAARRHHERLVSISRPPLDSPSRAALSWRRFFAACSHKVLHPDAFSIDIATCNFLPEWSVNGFALVLPWVEAFTRLMLVLVSRARAASLLAAE